MQFSSVVVLFIAVTSILRRFVYIILSIYCIWWTYWAWWHFCAPIKEKCWARASVTYTLSPWNIAETFFASIQRHTVLYIVVVVCTYASRRHSENQIKSLIEFFFHFARECLCAKDKTHALTAPYKHCTKRARTHTHTVHMTTTTEKTALSCWLAMSISILQFCYKSLV